MRRGHATESSTPPVQHRSSNLDGRLSGALSGHAGLVLADRHWRHRHRFGHRHRERRNWRPRQPSFHSELLFLVSPLISQVSFPTEAQLPGGDRRTTRTKCAQPAGSRNASRLRQPKSTERTGSAAGSCSNEVSEPIRSVTDREQGLEQGHFTSAGCSAHWLLTRCGPCRSPCPEARVTPRVGLPHPSPAQRLAHEPFTGWAKRLCERRRERG